MALMMPGPLPPLPPCPRCGTPVEAWDWAAGLTLATPLGTYMIEGGDPVPPGGGDLARWSPGDRTTLEPCGDVFYGNDPAVAPILEWGQAPR